MTPRVLMVGWALIVLVVLVLLGVEFSWWRSIALEQARTASERLRLANEIQLKEHELVTEMRKHAGRLQEMPWTTTGAEPSAFLTRLAELAGEKRLTILSVGPREGQNTPQFTRSWHAIQVRAPFSEIRELAARVEQDRGILDDVRIEVAPAPSGQAPGSSAKNELQARFRLTTLGMSPQTKLIVDRTLAAVGGTSPAPPGPSLALSVPPAKGGSGGRDPFAFLTPPAPPSPPAGSAAALGPPPDVAVKGIVSFPDGFLAIVNNQIVKVGDTVSGYRVERITEHSVTLSGLGGPPRTIELPELAPMPAPPPRS